MEPVDALDLQRLGAHPRNRRAHREQQIAQIDDLGLARGVLDHRAALGQHRRHHRILGRADRHDREGHAPAGQAPARRFRADIAGGDLDLRAHRLERLQVQVDRTVADRAAAGQRHRRLARARDQRPEHQDRRAHLADDVVRRLGRGQLARAHRHHAAEILGPRALDLGRRAELVEQMPEAVDIGEPRQVAQRHRLLGQQRARHQRQRRILRARDGQFAGQAIAAADEDTVHGRASIAATRSRRKRWRIATGSQRPLIDFNARSPAPCFVTPGSGESVACQGVALPSVWAIL